MTEVPLIQSRYKAGYYLNGLTCTSCAAKIEKAVQELPYVEEAEINFAAGKIRVSGNNEKIEMMAEDIQKIVNGIEKGITVLKEEEKNQHNTDGEKAKLSGEKDYKYLHFRFWPGLIMFALALVFFEIPAFKIQVTGSFIYLRWLLYGSSYILIGGPVLMTAVSNIRRGKVFDEHFLMSIATLGAFVINEHPEGVAVMLFYMVGELFQNRAVEQSRRSIKKLMNIRPDYANLKEGDSTTRVRPEIVSPGDVIVIKPGERVPLDGIVLEGTSMLDTSALTGESIPRRVERGDEVLSGMINKEGLLTVRVNKEYGQSTVARILDLVENAIGKKAPTEKLITKLARYYTPIVVYAALGIAVLPPIFMRGASLSDWVYRALVFLVISCPCALVVSIPLGFFGGIGRASRQGILIKGGNILEALNNVTQIVFDKTGTLTRGEFAVTKVEAYDGFTEDELLTKAAFAEGHTSHPLARSIVEAYGKEVDTNRITEYQEVPGKGIKSIIDGQEVLAGNNKLLVQEGIDYPEVDEDGTIVFLAVDKKYAGYIVINDELKMDALETIKGLKKSGVKELTMLTGDRETVARRVARKLGLDYYHAELLPIQKVEKLEEILSNKGKREKILFIGDGINDAPVLARADIGVAMGGLGSDAAIEAADIVLMTDEPSKLLTAFGTARKTRQIIWQNIILALGVKGIVLGMGALGIATMWGAVFADVGVALLAVLNALRIIRRGGY